MQVSATSTIPDGQKTSGKVARMDVPAVQPGDQLTVLVAQVGSTAAGVNLSIQVELY